MSNDDKETDAYFDGLAGRSSPDGTLPGAGAQAMRTALLAQLHTLREAQEASATELSAKEVAQMDAIKQRLLQDGVLKTTEPPHFSKRKASGPPMLDRLRDWLLGGNWPRAIAVAASVMLVSTLVMRLSFVQTEAPDVERGGTGTPTLRSPHPADTAASLAARVRAAGGEVLLVQVSEQEWTLLVTIPRSVDGAGAVKVLSDAGIKVAGNGPYRVLVRSTDSDH